MSSIDSGFQFRAADLGPARAVAEGRRHIDRQPIGILLTFLTLVNEKRFWVHPKVIVRPVKPGRRSS